MSFTVIDVETTGHLPWEDRLVAVGIGETVHRPDVGRSLARHLLAGRRTVVAHTNYDLRWLVLDGARLGPGLEYHDTKVMAWMLDGTQPLDLESLAVRYLDHVPPKLIKVRSGVVMFEAEAGLVPIEDAPWMEMVAYNESDLKTTARLYVELRDQLQARGIWDHFLREEAPFSKILIEMEGAGVPYDAEAGLDLRADLEAERAELRGRLVRATGWSDFNPGSGDQVADFLYSDFYDVDVKFEIPRLAGLPQETRDEIVRGLTPERVRLTKVGREYAYGKLTLDGRGLRPPKSRKNEAKKRPTVSTKKLKVMYGSDPWVADYVAHSGNTKMIGYLDDWQARVHDGRLHGRFDQAGTITGRLSSREPNLQQVASRSGVRGLFKGDLVVGDYAGLEVRLSAHFSGDETMLDIFRNGKDLYGTLAARAWGGEEAKSNAGRGLMKVLMLASQYGAQGETLAETLAQAGMKYSSRQADALLKDLEGTMPRLFEWRQEVIERARREGYVTTLAGRERMMPDLHSAEWKTMAKAERQAVNSIVQGSAADVVRRAMLDCRAAFMPVVARMLLQVHDEIMWSRGPEWVPEVTGRLQTLCESVFDLDVPLVFEIAEVSSWAGKGGDPGQVEAGAYAALGT